MFKSSMDWLNNMLKDGFGWSLAASITCCGEPEEDSAAYKEFLKQAHATATTLGND